ncbi:S-acyl fatty acid synthase thioesterase, medium chain-like isoform X1 [Littorina saxatilis]|uniref:oleoyl-[acyl-carrier-protein] hydrolase n=1 Tax=Littorina saxatilis TaxID=31220 RepID=A0AAN9GJL7_9CAEN
MTEKLLTCRVKKPKATVRLVVFPWSGSGASAFTSWPKLLSDNVEMVGVTLPGRETRYKEECCFSAQQIASDIAGAIHKHYADKPFFFCGHSQGALLCTEVAATLRQDYGLAPARIYLSGESPPHSTKRQRERKDYRAMNEADFTKEVLELNFLPLNITTNPELLKVYLPALRADLTVVDQLIYDLPQRLLKEPLNCPLSVFVSIEDIEYDQEAWKQLTQGLFNVKKFVGAHFYMKDPHNQKIICDLINADAAALQ